MWSRLVDATAPPERLAAFRIAVGIFAVTYLAIRFPVFWGLADKSPSAFAGVGPLGWRDEPLPSLVVQGALLAALASGISTVLGYRHRISGPLFAASVLLLTAYRSSWGQLLHFENVFTLHVVLLAAFPAADAWSLDARRTGGRRRDPTTYGLALQLACLCVVTTYVIAGLAKLRLGGSEWALGDTLRNHIAYSAVRLDLLGADGSPLAGPVVRNAWLLPPMAVMTLIIELAAPVALIGPRLRNTWVAAAWTMHLGIFALMLIGFPYPLFLVAFAPFFALEQLVGRVAPRWAVHDEVPPARDTADDGRAGARRPAGSAACVRDRR